MLFMVISSALCIFMCICEMIYLMCKRMTKLLWVHYENERFLYAEQHELTKITPPRYRKTDPTLTESQMGLNRREKAKDSNLSTTL